MWLTNDDNPFSNSIPGYSKIFSKYRAGTGGGVMIQDRQDLVVVKTLPSESVTVKLKNKNVRFQVGVVYNTPTGNKQDFLDKAR